jgi:putative PIN family toxin of toxin-antitoxin system
MDLVLQLVLDTNILIAALRSKWGASYRLIQSIEGGRWTLNISVALALEYEEILKRPDILPGFTEQDVDRFLNYLFSVATLVPSVATRRPNLPDPDDECILELAAQRHAIIVTHNRRHFLGAEKLGVSVMSPAEALSYLGEAQ